MIAQLWNSAAKKRNAQICVLIAFATMAAFFCVLIAFAALAALANWVLAPAYTHLGLKGDICEFGAAMILGLSVMRRLRNHVAHDGSEKHERINANFFLVMAFLFLGLFPFSLSLQIIGLAPGIVYIVLFSYLWVELTGKATGQAWLAAALLCVFVWIWAEAGMPGLVVMPVDLPAGRTDLGFTSEGVANALETELQNFGLDDTATNFRRTEAAQILASDLQKELFRKRRWGLFPENPWYKGSEARPAALSALHASHFVAGTKVEGFPLVNIYHILRYLRGKELLEGQILIGADHSMTLALRRYNYPPNCTTESMPDHLLQTKSGATDNDAIRNLRNVMQQTKLPEIQRALGCSPSFARRAFEWLGISDSTIGDEEKIADVTVGGELKGNAQLEEALRMAELEAMEHLSPERLALYYDNAGEYESALTEYKRALPMLVKEAICTPLIQRGFVRERLANALVRIGDFEDETACLPKKQESPGTAASHDRPYTLAQQVLPNDLNTEARIGYGFLISERELEWSGRKSCLVDGEPLTQQRLLTKSAEQLQSAAHLDDASDPKTREIRLQHYGCDRWRQVLAWVNANLAYTLGIQQNWVGAATAADKAGTYDLTHNLSDMRTKAVSAYVKSKIHDCKGAEDLLKAVDSQELPGDDYTLHNQILMEEQLVDARRNCSPNNQEDLPDLKEKLLLQSLQALIYLPWSARYWSKDAITYIKPIADRNHPDLQNAANLRREFVRLRLSPPERRVASDWKTHGLCALTWHSSTWRHDELRAWSLCVAFQALSGKRISSDMLRDARAASAELAEDPYVRVELGLAYLISAKI